MFKVNNKAGVFIANFEHISHLVLRFLLLALSRKMPVGLLLVGPIIEALTVTNYWEDGVVLEKSCS